MLPASSRRVFTAQILLIITADVQGDLIGGARLNHDSHTYVRELAL